MGDLKWLDRVNVVKVMEKILVKGCEVSEFKKLFRMDRTLCEDLTAGNLMTLSQFEG